MAFGMSEERAYYWAEKVRKGILMRERKTHRLSEQKYEELAGFVGEVRAEELAQISYLPSRWNVLERYYQNRKD